MSLTKSSRNFESFLPQRTAILVRGLLMTFTGLLLMIFSAIHPEVKIMSQLSAWLPVVAIAMLAIGLFECLDVYISRHSQDFFTNLQLALFDTVVGIIILSELNKSHERLILLVATYLLVKGAFRFLASTAGEFPYSTSAKVGGAISVILGLLLWQEWPFSSIWFICFCLSIDIATRGWALTRFGMWLNHIHNSRAEDPSLSL